ncbi:hypothetical protein [Tropicimonas isoalkanivorans]|uniref:Ferredoxin n=1 Tax=Tropicimonas isoalkanivorans TaxID=441112 RepID=A0A1I1R719_9RHOB|nr:hypothetical protein [Tropicimonas isoalkanivorans]SFD27363.1 hypothetical protein SAMN04488094_12530 [Tropicimonas isoalkanivorans]
MQQQAEITKTPASTTAPTEDEAPALPPLRPALFARYTDLESLRYDYPLVLLETGDGGPLFRPLSRIVDDVLSVAAPPDASGEAMRQQVLRLEARIRRNVALGREGMLSDLWQDNATRMVKESGQSPFGSLGTNLDIARKRLTLDGVVIGCDHTTPGKVVTHTWRAKQNAKARRFRRKVEGLILRLTDILKSDHMKSDEAHSAGALASAMGQDQDSSIDFGSLSRILDRARPEDRLPEDRVRRIKTALEALQCQPFFGPGRATEICRRRPAPYSYTFDSCAAALDALRERLPAILEFTKAVTIAELEVENKYRPDLHDPIFETFDVSDLTADQMELLPGSLILLHDGVTESAEIARAFEALAGGLQITVLIQVDDILGPTSPEPPRNSFGAGTARLASMAMGLNNAFVLQASSAHLYRMQEAFQRGIQHQGPALFSIYSGATRTVPGVPPYVLSAAATESRAFPNFTYDPSAGSDLAARFNLAHNPQVGVDWPEHRLDYETADGERQSEALPFTFADFAIGDVRYQRFCHPAAQDDWTPDMVPFGQAGSGPGAKDRIPEPYVLGLTPENGLLRVGVDDKIVQAAARCNDAWRRLQELAGINNSHALRLLSEERKNREASAIEIAAALPTADATPALPEAPPSPVQLAQEPAPEPTGDDPWIETARCTTCKECTQINSALFKFDENMQAYIADPDAGTYRQIVEAAESCQVSIIHPGQPRNLEEADLDELRERAKPFL